MAVIIRDDWGREYPHADQVHADEKPSHSLLLGPDGNPLQYERRRVGFDLTQRPLSRKVTA